jgi:ribonuclease HI
MCTSRQIGGRHEFEQAGVWGSCVALQSAALSDDVPLLCDNAAFLCAIKKWVGQGGKATLATAPDADILQEVVCLLTQRVRAGRATFLIKVKSHRGEPINERADTLAEEGREISDDNRRWDVRTDCMTFEVQKGNTTVRSVWTNSVCNAFRRQAGWAKLQEVRATAAKHWTEYGYRNTAACMLCQKAHEEGGGS